MVDIDRIESLVEWKRSMEPHIPVANLVFDHNCIEALGDDPEELVSYIRSLDKATLQELHLIEWELVEKFQTDEIRDLALWMEEQVGSPLGGE